MPFIVAGGLALLAQALLIAGLLVNRRRRQRTEQSLRDNVAGLEAARRALSTFSGRLMEAQEQERTRLARELHDEIGQRVSFLAMDVARLRDTLPDGTDAREQARGLQESVLALGREVQGISGRLHSSKIDLLGLPGAAESFCREFASRHSFEVEFTHRDVPSPLPDAVSMALFRVLQEAVSNAAKYSHAQQCRATLQHAAGELKLDVIDEGRGFDAGAAFSGPGLGLISMRERLNLVNGELEIESTVGRGTAVRARVSLRSNPEARAQTAASSADPVASSTTA